MTTLDAGFLAAEDSDRRVSLAVLEGPTPDHESLTSNLAQRISTCPRFAQRLRRRAFDLGAPEWVDDPGFDLAHQVRRIALPSPGDDQQLCRLVAEVMSQRLDRSRPLWEIHVIEGLTGDRCCYRRVWLATRTNQRNPQLESPRRGHARMSLGWTSVRLAPSAGRRRLRLPRHNTGAWQFEIWRIR